MRRDVVVNGGNEFHSQHMEILWTGTDDGARVEIRFGEGEAVRTAGWWSTDAERING